MWEWESITKKEYHQYFRDFAEAAMKYERSFEKAIFEQPLGEPIQILVRYGGTPKLMYRFSKEIEYFKIKPGENR